MSIHRIGALCVALVLCLFLLSRSAMGQPFSPPGPATDMTTSLGQFSIVVNPVFARIRHQPQHSWFHLQSSDQHIDQSIALRSEHSD